MRLLLLILLLFSTLLAKNQLETMGDVGQFAIPLTAYAISFSKHDVEGAWQLTRAGALTLGVTYALKVSCNTPRPNGRRYSFPSGHSAAAFAGAAYLDRRYGIAYGLPAYLAAAFVGYTRIHAKAHRPIDVLAAAVLAYGINTLLTTRWQPSFCLEQGSCTLSFGHQF